MVTLIANTGIQMLTAEVTLNLQKRHRMWFHEWYDTGDNKWKLELVTEVEFPTGTLYYRTVELRAKGYLVSSTPIYESFTPSDLAKDDVNPIANEDGMVNNVPGQVFRLTFNDRNLMLSSYENVWLPVPYFVKKTAQRSDFGPLNWARLKLIPQPSKEDSNLHYTALLAFDTRAAVNYEGKEHRYKEYPVFGEEFISSLDLELCKQDSFVLDYCAPAGVTAYVDERLRSLAHPEVSSIGQIAGRNNLHLTYVATYVLLMDYLAKNDCLPKIRLCRDKGAEHIDIDMIVDIGNSRTTALLIEDNTSFNQTSKLQLTDYTSPLRFDQETGTYVVNRHGEPFDMRVALRRANFGGFGPGGSQQFVYPSLVRLGNEANELIHRATANVDGTETLSTYSSPKRYLWDSRRSKEEWRFLTIEGEPDDHILYVEGLSRWLDSDGKVDPTGSGGVTFHYSRRSLMTFSFLEMLVQARTQINSVEYRENRGLPTRPRRVRRVVITCPTAMSKVEREALVTCAREAVALLNHFDGEQAPEGPEIEVVPPYRKESWYYDEATCAQLVYMYGEVGYKYRGAANRFFDLYGKKDATGASSLTLASLDIGAGTSDLMISRYDFKDGALASVAPDPLFYDSYYYAGDDMLRALVKNIIIMSPKSAIRQALSDLSFEQYVQKMRDFVGPDYNGQTINDRQMRRDFNLQYSVPLMSHFLELVRRRSHDCTVTYNDVFADIPVSAAVEEYYQKRMGHSLRDLVWEFNYEDVCSVIANEFEPLLRKVATIMFAHSCDIVLLSGRPASLAPIREVLLKYYCVAPNRLILLNDYFVGDWYPYDNNTGYVVDAKPIVAIGAAIAHYGSHLANLQDFSLDISRLRENLKSTVNYVSGSNNPDNPEYVLTPDRHSGDLVVTTLPTMLNVSRMSHPGYPSRALYRLDFDRTRIAERVEASASAPMTQGEISVAVNEAITGFQRRMPFKVTLAREPDELEAISIESIEDAQGNDIPASILRLNIQSLGAEDKYWLDTGAFPF